MSDSQSNYELPLSPFPKPTPKSHLFNKKLQKLQSVDRQIRRKWVLINTQNRKREQQKIKQLQQKQRSLQRAQKIVKQAGLSINNPLNEVILGHRVNKIERQKQQRRQIAVMLRNKYYEEKLYGKSTHQQNKVSKKKRTAVSYKMKNQEKHFEPLARKCSQLDMQISENIRKIAYQDLAVTQELLLQSKRQKQGFTFDLNQSRKRLERQKIIKTQADQPCQMQKKRVFGRLKTDDSGNGLNRFFRVKSEHLEQFQADKAQYACRRNIQFQVPTWLQKRSPKKNKLLQIISFQYKNQLKKMNRQSHAQSEKYTDSKLCFLNKIKGRNTKLYYKLISPWETKDPVQD